MPGRAEEVRDAAKARGINVWLVDADHVSVSCDEATTAEHVEHVLAAFGAITRRRPFDGPDIATRTSEFLTHPAFTRYRTETEMMRYLRSLADKDIALGPQHDSARFVHDEAQRRRRDGADHLARVRAPASVRAARRTHPGLRKLIADLETWLTQLTGYDAVSLQPNAGSQGEYAGLLAIRPTTRAR